MLNRRRRIVKKPRRRVARRRVYAKKRRLPLSKVVRVNAIPQRFFAKLHYVEYMNNTLATTAYTSWPFWSSAYDPYAAAGGHQPLYFDQYAAIYNNYRVYGFSYRARCEIVSGASSLLYMYAYDNTDGTADVYMPLSTERLGTKFTSATYNRTGLIKGYNSVAKTFRVSKSQVRIDDRYAGITGPSPAGTNPTNASYTHIQLYNPTSGTIGFSMVIRFVYYVEFFNPRQVGQS